MIQMKDVIFADRTTEYKNITFLEARTGADQRLLG